MKQFLKPTWANVLLTIALSIIALNIQIKSLDSPLPKSPLYDLVASLPLDQDVMFPFWLYLIFPMIVVGVFLSAIGVKVWTAGLWLHALAHGIYFYLLVSLLASSFSRYSGRLPKWLWAVVLLAPLALYLFGTTTLKPRPPTVPFSLSTLAEEMGVALPILVVSSLYVYLLFCLCFFVYDTGSAWRKGLIKTKRLVASLVVSIPSLGCLLLSISMVMVPIFIVWLFMVVMMHPLTDHELINHEFTPHLPGFSDIRVLQREEHDGGFTKVLTITVSIDGYPDKVVCQGVIYYKHGDPTLLATKWADKSCEEKYFLARKAQYMLDPRSAEYPLSEQDHILAHLLAAWIKQGKIKPSDIKHPEMRALVTRLLEQGEE